jgi:hypothetical protein
MLGEGEDDDALDCSTAAIETVRAWSRPDLVCEPERAPPRDIVELDALRSAARDVEVLRLTGAQNALGAKSSTAGMRLRGGRHLLAHNLRMLGLPRCEVVELWASTSHASEIAGPTRDAIPPLIWCLIASGARSVIDLAWPVPDPIKAIMIEQFFLARESDAHPVQALNVALKSANAILEAWRHEAAASASYREALAILDGLRIEAARAAGHPLEKIVAFATRGGDSAQPLDELASAQHLAAFRCWTIAPS